MAHNPKKYPPNWNYEIRPAILKRDKYRCGKCGLKQLSKGVRDAYGVFHHVGTTQYSVLTRVGYEPVIIFLSVAHLDHNTKNNDYNNLVSMCQQCHNRYDAKTRGMNRRVNKANKGDN